jgi:hypothetical protein
MTDEDLAALRRDKRAEYLALGMDPKEAALEAERAASQLKARLDWLKSRFARMKALHAALADYWGDYFEAHPEADPDDPDFDEAGLPEPPEQAELETIEAEIEAVRLHDRWPRHLHWPGV